MSRQTLTDGTGRWFLIESAEAFDEDTYWDGNNNVSCSAGRHNGERLYRTAGGRWILHNWSAWQGCQDGWNEVSNEEAAQWLSINGHGPHEACKEEFAALEIA
jgi:hypothetical protein